MKDWGGYGAIIEEAREIKRNEQPPVACPRCGEPLVENPRGVKACPLGHFRTN